MKRLELETIQVTIRGQPWEIRFVGRKDMPRATWGDCNRESRVLRVRKDLSPVNFTDTLIHEIRHAQHDVLFEAEEFIDSTSTEIAEILIATGKVIVTPKKSIRRTKRK